MGEVDAGRGGRLHVGGSHVRGLDRLLLPHRPRRHRRRGRLRHAARDPAAGAVGRSTTTAAGLRPASAGRATPSSRPDARATPGASTAPTSARRSSPTRGEQVRVDVTNALDEPTTVHWHGMHLPAEMDGGPHQMIEPDATWSPELDIDQPAATLWYHPHPHGETEEHVARGLAGHVHRADDAEAALPLPREYGVDDVPVIVQDTRLRRRRRARHAARASSGGARRRAARQRHARPLPRRARRARAAAPAQRLDGRIYAFTWSDGRRVELDRDRRRAARGIRSRSTGCCCRPANAPRSLVRVEPGRARRAAIEATAGPRASIGSIAAMNGGSRLASTCCELRAADTLDAAADVPARARDVAARSRGARRRRPAGSRSTASRSTARRWTWAGSTRPSRSTRTERWMVDEHDGRAAQLPRARRAVPHRLDRRAPPPPELAGWKDTIFTCRRDRVRAASCASRTTPTPTRRTCTTATCCGTRTRA